MYKMAFFVPMDAAESVKQAVFEAGAGSMGNYENVCFQTRGTGQFRPTEGANPHIGTVDSLESVEEFKVEMVCDEAHIHGAIAALKLAHPYEEVAYDVWLLADL